MNFKMSSVHIKSLKILKRISFKKKFLESKLKVKLEIKGKIISISGSELSKYEAVQIFEAINFGFEIETALLLLDENYIFEIINIKNLTRRTDLSQVRARIIGRKGKTLKVLQDLTECFIKLHDNQVYIIGPAERIKDCLNGLRKLIQGSKQSSTYAYLEKQRKQPEPADLGLKIKE